MGFITNRLLRGATNRTYERLAHNYSPGPATLVLALAIGHTCYPKAQYGDKAEQDKIIMRLQQSELQPCSPKEAWKHVEDWLVKCVIDKEMVFLLVWGMKPLDFVQEFLDKA